jgi:hypothetical protein
MGAGMRRTVSPVSQKFQKFESLQRKKTASKLKNVAHRPQSKYDPETYVIDPGKPHGRSIRLKSFYKIKERHAR